MASEYQTTTPGESQGSGWLFYAGTMLGIVGVLNIFWGLAFIAQDDLVVTGPDAEVVLIGSTTGWGWVLLIIGVIEILASVGVVARQQWARWFGIIVASLGLIAQFPVFFGPHPLWALTIVILCALVIYGLAAYGGRDTAY